LLLAPHQDLEDQLIAFFAVLPHQRLEVLNRRGFERFEAVALVDLLDDADDVLPPSDVLGQEVAHAARRFCACHLLGIDLVD
jgi:hypothetical protein